MHLSNTSVNAAPAAGDGGPRGRVHCRRTLALGISTVLFVCLKRQCGRTLVEASEEAAEDDGDGDEACKRTMAEAWAMLAGRGVDTDALWAEVKALLGRAVACMQPELALAYASTFGVKVGLGRIVALYHRSSTSYHIH
jgi:hypothetical protein